MVLICNQGQIFSVRGQPDRWPRIPYTAEGHPGRGPRIRAFGPGHGTGPYLPCLQGIKHRIRPDEGTYSVNPYGWQQIPTAFSPF